MLQLSETSLLADTAFLEESLADALNKAAKHEMASLFFVDLSIAASECFELTSTEAAEGSRFTDPSRLSSWRRGRAALKLLLQRLGLPADTSTIALPHRNFSLTHSADLAVAARVRMQCGNALKLIGTGVDFEAHRQVNPRSARFFLQQSELNWLGQCSEVQKNSQLLRLWTVKEAIFKADITNRSASRLPGEYELTEPAAVCGKAVHPALPGIRFFYASTALNEGPLSMAVAVEGN